MVKATTSAAIVVALAALSSTVAIPLGNSEQAVAARDDSGLAARATTLLPTGSATARPSKTNTGVRPKQTGKRTKKGGKKQQLQKQKQQDAALNKELLQDEFSLEKARLDVEKQENSWKPTARDFDEYEFEARAVTTSATATGTARPSKTNTGVRPKQTGKRTKKGGKKQQKQKQQKQADAALDKELLQDEFSLEKARLDVEKQENSWKPTARDFDDFELDARDFDDFEFEARDFDDFEFEARAVTTSATATGTARPSKTNTGTRPKQTGKRTKKGGKKLQKQKQQKQADAALDKELLQDEFSLEKARLDVEKQENSWKPTARDFDEYEFEARAVTTSATATGTARPSKTNTGVRPKQTGKRTKKGGKKQQLQKQKQQDAALNKELLQDEFSLEKARLDVEKQENSWKPTARDFDDYEFEARAVTTSAAATGTARPSKTNTGVRPKQTGKRTKKGGKKLQKQKQQKQADAALDKELLQDEFSLEKARLDVEKQENSWKPTARDFDDFEFEARDFDDFEIDARDFDDFEFEARAVTTSATATGTARPSKTNTGTRPKQTGKRTKKGGKKLQKQKQQKQADAALDKELLQDEFSLEKARLDVEKQENSWKPTARGYYDYDLEELD